MICMSWRTVLRVRPSEERLDGFQAVRAVPSRGGSPGEAIWGSLWEQFGFILGIIFLMVF